MIRKFILGGLIIVVIASFIQILSYFYTGVKTQKEIPTVSEIFTPILLGYGKLGDEQKSFYPERLIGFSDSVKNLISSNGSFVKTVKADYVVGGEVVKVEEIGNQEVKTNDGYNILFKNSSKDTYVEHISSAEAQYAKIYIRTMFLNKTDFSRLEASFADIKEGDYLVLKRSTNLLNPTETSVEAEILRTKR